MAKGRIRVLSTVPGATSLSAIVTLFCRQGEGVVTAFSDAALPLLKRYVDEDDAVEVKPFGEVVMRFLELCGEETLPIAQLGHTVEAIARACQDLPDDSPFLLTARHVGLHQALARTLKELREWGIDRHDMLALAEKANTRLAAKLRSLAHIDESTDSIMLSLGRQTHSDHLQACLQAIPERDGSFDRLLVIVGSEECPTRIEWLRWAARNGTDITVVFERHAADLPLFPGARRAAELLGEPVQVTGAGNVLLDNLFASSVKSGPKIEVSIVSAADPLAEAEWALRGCLEGMPESSGIYVRNLEAYAPLIEAAAKRFDIPVRIARRAPLLTNSFARLTLTAIEFCASNDVRSLAPILRSSYLGLSGEHQAQLLSTLRECHSTRSRQWETLSNWAAQNKDRYPWLSYLLEWRHKAEGSFSLAEWLVRMRELIDPGDCLPWGARMRDGDRKMAERDRRARHQMERLLANHVTVDSVTLPRSITLREAAGLCRELWENSDVSIPPAEFGVCVSDDPYAFPEIEVLHVMGMLEGVFPRRRSEEPILTDFEREEISALRPGKARLLSSHDQAESERDTFYRVCAVARSRVVFSYPLADDQRDNIPAFYLTEVERAMGGPVTRRDYPRTLIAPAGDRCASVADRRLREALDAPRELPPTVELVTEEAREALTPKPEHRFTPGELRDVLQCPFQSVLRHRLHLRVGRRGNRWQSLRKIPQASSLIGQRNRAEAESALMGALEAELDALYSDVPDWEMQLLRAGGRRLIRDWLQREFRARETWPKEQGSVVQNVAFGEPRLRDTMPGGVRLDGVVPAVSHLQRYSVAHLYGSGARDPKNLTEEEKLYFGLFFLALFETGREGALEIESMRGKRELMVLTRAGGSLNGHVQDGLSVIDLATADDPALSKKIFYDEVKRALKRAVDRVNRAAVDAMKGDHCDWCDYGELCRRSRAFGEEDSPFGRDTVLDDE